MIILKILFVACLGKEVSTLDKSFHTVEKSMDCKKFSALEKIISS